MNCDYNEKAVVNTWEKVALQLGGWARG